MLALFIVCFWYLGAAALSATFPAPGRAQAAYPEQQAVFLCEAPFHTDIALPFRDPTINWREELAGSLPPWLGADTYLLFGWGDSVFFTQVLEPADLTPGRALSALAGANPTAVRIVPVAARSVAEYCMPLAVDAPGRSAIIDHIRESFRHDALGNPRFLATPVDGEILVHARGRYSLFNTCNQWTARALGKAGLARAGFAPFSSSVTRPVRPKDAE